MIKIFIIPLQFMAWQLVILEYLNQCLRLTTFGEKHCTTLGDIYFHLMTLNMEFSEVPIFLLFFYACHEVTMIIMMMIAIIVLNSSLGFFPISSAFWKMFNKQNNNINNISYYYR